MSNNTYQNQSIRKLSEREQCRLKLPMYFGDRSNVLHSVRETILNSRDEVINNFDKGEITVTLYNDCETVDVLDTGRGMNLKGESDGEKNYYLLLEKLGAGGNHDNLELGIASTGTNSVGLTCTNYCAEVFEVTSYKNHEYFKVSYVNGGELVGVEEGVDQNIEHGTRVKFKQDKNVYTGVGYDPEDIKTICNKIASTSNKIKYTFIHKDETFEFDYADEIEYLDENIVNKLSSHIKFEDKLYTEDVMIEGKMYQQKDIVNATISLSSEPLAETFLNGTWLVEGGSILDGIVDGLRRVFQKEIKTKTKITATDVLMSFNVHCNVVSTNPSFANQTKFSSASPTYKRIAADYIISNMEVYKAENPQEFDKILKHLQQINSFNSKNEASRKKIKKELEEKANNAINRPAKLVPCRTKDPKKAKIALLEGDSALNSVKLGRDAETLMVLPLKGKPINAFKCSLDKLLENQEVRDIFKILGCGITYKGKNVKGFNKFNIEDLCVCEVDIICDRDEDGGHLETLVIGLFYILAPELIKRGIIRIIETPLYIIKTKDKDYYAYSEIERVNIINSLTCQYKETRYKGIGGLPVNVMHMALADETKRCITITMKDAKKCGDMIELFLSDDIESRKKYISEHGSKYVSDDIYA